MIFALVAAGAVAFQLGLALGAPWGAYAMAGRYPGAFPLRLRVAAAVQAALLALLAIVVLSDAGVALEGIAQAAPWLIANVIAFLASGLARHATGTTIDINGASYVR